MRILLINILFLVSSFLSAAEVLAVGRQPLLVEANWLKERIDDASIMIIDVRKFEEYQSSHIKNAVNLPVDGTFGTGVHNNLLAPISVIGDIFNQASIEHSAHLVLYDGGRLIDAARLFWVLEVFGHNQVSVLNGGLKEWESEQYPLSQEIPPSSVSNFIPAINPAALATTFSVQFNNSNNTHVLIDVRPNEEYVGLKSRTDQFGHIPSAINIPTENLKSTKTEKLLPRNKLAELFQFLDKDKPITVYCNKGKKSALSYFALRQLGYIVNAYNGSWFEWSKYEQLPKEMGDSIKVQ